MKIGWLIQNKAPMLRPNGEVWLIVAYKPWQRQSVADDVNVWHVLGFINDEPRTYFIFDKELDQFERVV